MGTVHKFKRPPKNQQQFKGYRPGGPDPRKPPQGPGFWQRLRSWQRSALAWTLLVALAGGIVWVQALLG
jgi:hypothetical protein